jgi:hypothetical protein
MAEALGRFLGPYLVARRFTLPMGIGANVNPKNLSAFAKIVNHPIADEFTAALFAEFVAFGALEEGLSAFILSLDPPIGKPILAWLADRNPDKLMEARFKQAIEALAMGSTFEGGISAGRAFVEFFFGEAGRIKQAGIWWEKKLGKSGDKEAIEQLKERVTKEQGEALSDDGALDLLGVGADEDAFLIRPGDEGYAHTARAVDDATQIGAADLLLRRLSRSYFDQARKAFPNVTSDQFDSYESMLRARARAWADRTGQPAEAYFRNKEVRAALDESQVPSSALLQTDIDPGHARAVAAASEGRFVEVSPEDFAKQYEKSPGAATLTAYTADELAGAKLYKLHNAEIYYALKETDGHWYTGKPGVELVSVMSNSGGTPGVATPGALLHAIENGATVLDAFDVKGRLPNRYRRFGFEEVGRVPFDSSHYADDPKHIERLEEFWQSQGWAKKLDDDGNVTNYPDVVVMELGANVERESVRRVYLEGGTALQRGDLPAARVVFDPVLARDGGLRSGEGRAGIEGQPGGAPQGLPVGASRQGSDTGLGERTYTRQRRYVK